MKWWTRDLGTPPKAPPGRDCPWYPSSPDLEDAVPSRPFFWRLGRQLASLGWLLVGVAAAAFFLGGYTYRALVTWPFSEPETPAERQERIVGALLPEGGVATGVPWGDTLARLVDSGALDPAKLAAALERSGHSMTPEQERILRGDSDAAIAIDRHNAHFVLNALWAVGIANDASILRDGPMGQLPPERRATLASTGGWTLGRMAGGEVLASTALIDLTAQQEAVLRDVAYATYRPCCDNPTAFPDCNHGAAALGLAELMAAAGAPAEEIFATLKGFNSFWYPDQFYMLARYFDQQGTPWAQVEGRDVLGAPYASKSGWTDIARQAQDAEARPGGGGGCAA